MPKQGTVVLTPFPFTDLNGNKVRPAVVLSKTKRGSDVIIAFITSKKKANKFSVKIEPTKENGLKINSLVVCEKLATLDIKVFVGEIGILTTADLKKVKSILKEIFEL